MFTNDSMILDRRLGHVNSIRELKWLKTVKSLIGHQLFVCSNQSYANLQLAKADELPNYTISLVYFLERAML
jgi:hypothetical protein